MKRFSFILQIWGNLFWIYVTNEIESLQKIQWGKKSHIFPVYTQIWACLGNIWGIFPVYAQIWACLGNIRVIFPQMRDFPSRYIAQNEITLIFFYRKWYTKLLQNDNIHSQKLQEHAIIWSTVWWANELKCGTNIDEAIWIIKM